VSEVIVVDDCSDDDPGEVARAHGARVVRHERNRGLAAARNTGIRSASQPWIALLDADDEWVPSHLARLWALHEGHNLVGGTAMWMDETGRARRVSGPLGRGPREVGSPADLLYPENYLSSSAMLVRREAVEAVGWYDESLREVEDLDIHVRMVELGGVVAVPEIVTIYHVHSGQMTQDRAKLRGTHEAVVLKYRDRPWWTPELLERVRAVGAWDELRECLSAGDRRGALGRAAYVARSPVRLGAVARLWAHRRAIRRGASGAGGG
jgi:glycosyltransferase involved in cell wall biosynthesis